MIILSKLQPWPTIPRWAPDNIQEDVPRSFSLVVADARARFMHKNGSAPNAILIGPTAKAHLQEEIANLPMKRMSAPEIKLLEDRNGGLAEYMGMTIHWTVDEGLHLMRD